MWIVDASLKEASTSQTIININVVIKSPPSSSSPPTSSKQVVRAAGNKKCDFYTETRGFECVPYYQVLILPGGTCRQFNCSLYNIGGYKK